jgi:hypothetical protein
VVSVRDLLPGGECGGVLPAYCRLLGASQYRGREERLQHHFEFVYVISSV